MNSDIDKQTLAFIEKYAQKNAWEAPSREEVADNAAGFEFMQEVSTSYTYLERQIKDFSEKKAVDGWFETGEFERKLNELGRKEFVDSWWPKALESVKMRTSVRESVGTDIKKDIDKFLAEYERRKA